MVSLLVGERARFAGYAALNLPDDEGQMRAMLVGQSEAWTPSGFLASASPRGRGLAGAASSRGASGERRDEAATERRRSGDGAATEGFVRHRRAAVDLGHAGTFCHERLAALQEYGGEIAARVSLRAVEALESVDRARRIGSGADSGVRRGKGETQRGKAVAAPFDRVPFRGYSSCEKGKSEVARRGR